MTQSLWSKAAFSSSGICLDGCTADPSPLNLDASGGSVPANEVSRDTRGLLDRPLYSTGNAGSRSTCPSQFELDPSRESGAAHLARIPPPSSYDHHGWSMKSGHRAKRARVENIIKGMTCTDVTSHFNQTDCMQEDGGIQELLHQTRRERIGSVSPGQNQATRKEPGSQHRCLSHTEGETDRRWADSPEASPNDAFPDSCTEFESRKSQGWKKVELMNYFQSKPDRIKLMADILKYELSRAVSRSVDSIFKSVPLLQTPPRDAENPETGVPLQAAVHRENRLGFPCCGAAEIPDVQTEALSLVIQKPGLERPDSFVLEPRSAALKSSSSLCHESALHGEGSSERSRSTEHRLALRCWRDGGSEAGRSKQDARWNPFKVKSKVNSAPGRSPERPMDPVLDPVMDPVLLGSLSLPHVKLEADNLEKNNLYMLNECLTTNHLKKAKLMFFYTRYPSSLVLRMCFHDVQFTRCITSQLIKWFSNFREFYYIQMEKFARNALAEGVADVRDLTVDRESELFRALNTHYNKANDFQVPERFLEVAEITLREFYVAISLGKDHDPSWKKAIYKVICKLDSDVPAEFKRHYSG